IQRGEDRQRGRVQPQATGVVLSGARKEYGGGKLTKKYDLGIVGTGEELFTGAGEVMSNNTSERPRGARGADSYSALLFRPNPIGRSSTRLSSSSSLDSTTE